MTIMALSVFKFYNIDFVQYILSKDIFLKGISLGLVNESFFCASSCQ